MDYFSAFSVVLFSFYSVVVRSIDDKLDNSMDKLRLKIVLFMPFLSYYLYHIHHLLFVHFDYSFNMKANLVAGKTLSLKYIRMKTFFNFCYS